MSKTWLSLSLSLSSVSPSCSVLLFASPGSLSETQPEAEWPIALFPSPTSPFVPVLRASASRHVLSCLLCYNKIMGGVGGVTVRAADKVSAEIHLATLGNMCSILIPLLLFH